ncbi:CLUMA_CG017269, isoform A [Clunio marinus]|uniref:CLUMA_CG017269, isoform A n=1 Tax=Clunio marinus TaxID=568069 RepID=A0A1J1IYD5_9DIPT|nr:CLUMA_CG017269, isoform A [Clunio marinus]
MKIVAVTFILIVASVFADPISISDNNVGDIVNVGVNANAKIDSKVHQNIIEAILSLLNQQVIGVNSGKDATELNEIPESSDVNFSHEMNENVENL